MHNHCIASPLLVLLCIIIYLFFSFPLFILKLIYNQIFCDIDPFVEIKLFRDVCKDGSSSSGVTNSPHPRCVAESTSQPRWLPGVERTGAKATAAQEDEEERPAGDSSGKAGSGWRRSRGTDGRGRRPCTSCIRAGCMAALGSLLEYEGLFSPIIQ